MLVSVAGYQDRPFRADDLAEQLAQARTQLLTDLSAGINAMHNAAGKP